MSGDTRSSGNHDPERNGRGKNPGFMQTLLHQNRFYVDMADLVNFFVSARQYSTAKKLSEILGQFEAQKHLAEPKEPEEEEAAS